jgi:hypothetical protein
MNDIHWLIVEHNTIQIGNYYALLLHIFEGDLVRVLGVRPFCTNTILPLEELHYRKPIILHSLWLIADLKPDLHLKRSVDHRLIRKCVTSKAPRYEASLFRSSS